MPDWHAYVRGRLPPLGLSPEREAEIVDELADQLRCVHASALASGAPESAAEAQALAEIADWNAIARDILRAERSAFAAPLAAGAQHLEPAVSRFRGGGWLVQAFRDARYALRALSAQPLFAITTLLTLGVGIGATTVVFTLVHSVLLSPLPYHDPDRLMFVRQVVPEIADQVPVVGVNPRSFIAWQTSCRASCESLAAIARTTATLTGAGEPEGLVGVRTTASFFDVLGVPPLAGRPFQPSEETPGRDNVAILSYGFWQRRFGGDPAILGRVLTLDGRPVEIVGILPASFRLPELAQLSPPNLIGEPFEFFRPMAWPDGLRRSWGEYDNTVIVRVRSGITADAARAELTSITAAEFAQAPIHPYPVVVPLLEGITADARRSLGVLLGAVLAALLIACVNIAGLLASRWTGRQRELAIRTAIGAGRGRLAVLVGAESAVLAAAGGLLGVGFAALSLRAVLASVPAAIPRVGDVALDLPSLAFAVAATGACALVCSAVPAWRAARVDPGDTLKAASHTTAGGGRWAAVRTWLVGVQVALTTILLVVGGLLVASFVNVLRVDRGFSTASLVAGDIELPATRYRDAEARARFFDALLEDLERAPGVEIAALTRKLPLEGESTVDAMIPVGDARATSEQLVGSHLQVSAGYFRALNMPLVQGRLFTKDDHARPVAVITEGTARTLWPGQNAIGRSFYRSNRTRSWEVVGIVADSRIRGLEREPGLVAYVPYGLNTATGFSLVVGGRGGDADSVAGARQALARLDPLLPLQRVRTLDAVVDGALALRRFQIWLMGAFSLSGLLLACLGIYGVLSGLVEGRRGELAVRLALGASPQRVRRLIVRQGLTPVLAGLLVGLAAAVAAARAADALFFGIDGVHAGVFGSAAALVLAVATIACLEPAARAARTPLMTMLRR
jgi:putative ABC transport system permease protein